LANAGISLVNNAIGIFNYAGDLTDPNAPLTGLSYGANKLASDAKAVKNGIIDYATNTSLSQFGTDLSNLATDPNTAEDVLGGFIGGGLTNKVVKFGTVSSSLSKISNLQAKFNDLVKTDLLPNYLKLDPNLKSGYTGSFKTGKVGNANKPTFGEPINLNDFDIDFRIKSDKLFNLYGKNLRANEKFRELLKKTKGFEGLRPNKKGFSIKFEPSN